MEQPKHIAMQTNDGTKINLDALYRICPSCFTESEDADGNLRHVVDFEKLRALLGDDAVENAPEVYDFTWVGKRAAQREAMAPIRKTLRPCPEESVDWDTTHNLYIEGDNLEVLKLLQNSYMGKVKMIYIDPPYNTGNDFVYHDDFHRTQREEDEAAGVINEEGERMVKNTESNGKFHSDWCSMIYARLMVARSLLTEDGVIFISIDDNEYTNIKKICDEVFGEVNFITTFAVENNPKGRKNNAFVAESYEYCILFAKNKAYIHSLLLNLGLKKFFNGLHTEDKDSRKLLTDKYGTFKQSKRQVSGCNKSNNLAKYSKDDRCFTIYYNEKHEDIVFLNEYNRDLDEWILSPEGEELVSKGYTRYICTNNVTNKPAIPLYSKETLNKLHREHSLFFKDDGTIYEKERDDSQQITSMLTNKKFGIDLMTESATTKMELLFGVQNIFTNSKSVDFIATLVKLYPDKNITVLDFFSGSCTTAHSIFQSNLEDAGKRSFIMVQYPELSDEGTAPNNAGYKTICEIGKERIRRAGKKIKAENPLTTQDLDTGFRVFKCDDSNYKDVAFAPKDYDQDSLDLFLDNIKEDRTDLDLLFDCMLRWGVTLDLPLTTSTVDGCTIHSVNDGDLVACFTGVVTEAVIDAIARMHPVRVVFRDSSFQEAAEKMNLFELFKQKCDWTDEEVQNNVRVI